MLETVKAWLPVIIFLGSAFSIVAAFVWRYYQIRTHQTQIIAALTEVKNAIKTLADRQTKTSNIVIQLEADFRALNRDGSKLEGKVEILAKTLTDSICTMQAVSGSLDAVWRTLQVLNPDKVPRRASDG